MDNLLGFIGAYYVIPSIIIGMIGFLLGWFLKPSRKREGDLSIEGEGALRAEADSLRARVQDLEARLAGRDSEVSELKTQMAAASAAPALADVTEKTTDTDETYALEWQNRYLAARVKYLDSRLAEMDSAAKSDPGPAKSASTKAVAKPKTKAVAKTKKKVVAKTAAKPKTKVAAAKAAPASKAKTAVKPKAAKAAVPKKDAAFERYYEKVKAYDARASRKVVQNIVDYCGISLKSRDSSLVACSDEAELRRVANGFVTKKLGLEDGQMDLVKSVCEQMKGQRLKSRVTFYYLAAKKAKKLSLFK
ncbi:MAG: DUF2853 family protein [Litorimonas sp.]